MAIKNKSISILSIYLKRIICMVLKLLCFILWLILAPFDMALTIFFPKTRFHKLMNGFYHSNVKPIVTNGISSRASYTFAHGFLHIILFAIVATCSWYIFNINTSVVKNKYVKITTFSKTGHKLKGVRFSWPQMFELEEDSILKLFTIKFYPDINADADTANYSVTIHSNFDLQLDYRKYKKNNKIDYKVSQNKSNSITIEMNRPKLTMADDEFFDNIYFLSNAMVFDDDETPYVNFYISFDGQALAPDTAITNSRIDIYFNTEYKDGFGNMPYDIQIVKPEPDSNCPWNLSYNSQDKVMEVINRGLYVSTINRELKQKKDREAFLYSVVIGTLVSFLLSILINLFTKWRNLNQAEGNPNPYSQNIKE